MYNSSIANSILPGDLVFDIGAHTGDKSEQFVQKDAHVVCVEPQPAMFHILQNRYKNQQNVTIINKAIGRCDGELPMSICTKNPTISTFSDDWKKGRFAQETWDTVIMVPIITIDALIKQYGIPRYTKIDVEGFEKEVLLGLTKKIGIISFEFTAEYIKNAFECIKILISLGYTKFNISVGESEAFAFSNWITFYDLIVNLTYNVNQNPGLWGDIYAN